MNSQQIQSLINKTHVAVVNTVTGGHWNYSDTLQNEYDNTNFRDLDTNKIPDENFISDFEIEVYPRAGDFIETLINVLHGDEGCFTDINTKAMDTDCNVYWCFDDDIHLLIFLAKEESYALDKFREKIESYK